MAFQRFTIRTERMNTLKGHWLPVYSMNVFAIVNIIKVIKMPLYIVHFIKKIQ